MLPSKVNVIVSHAGMLFPKLRVPDMVFPVSCGTYQPALARSIETLEGTHDVKLNASLEFTVKVTYEM
jgi:hypothetical protein